MIIKIKSYKTTIDNILLKEYQDKINELDSIINNFEPVRLTKFWDDKIDYSKMWLPEEGDLKENLNIKSNSWFPIKEFKTADYNEKIDDEFDVVKSLEEQKENNIKTMKFKLFLNDKEKEKLQTECFNPFRWYTNMAINVIYLEHSRLNKKLKSQKSISYFSIRQAFLKYTYKEEKTPDGITWCDMDYDENNKTVMIPDWMNKNVNSRVYRGAIKKTVTAVNSALSNLRNKNIDDFTMHYKGKKDDNFFVSFEDSCFPSWIRNLKAVYWYKTKDHKRKKVSFQDVFNDTQQRGLELIYEKHTDTYFLHYPVDINYFYNKDIRNDNQAKYVFKNKNRIISLDPGIRKFMVGYDSRGKIIYFADKSNLEIMKLLYKLDDMISDAKLQGDDEIKKLNRFLIRKKVKNMVSDMHWKIINFLISNYDTILLPEFKTSEMKKGKKLSSSTKRMLDMFSFYKFKTKLEFKCSIFNKKLVIVDESYTSKTCGKCGCQNNVGGSEVYHCSSCNITIDRDVNGARNIFLKNMRYIKTQKGTLRP